MSLIRTASPHDLPGVYRVCLQTGDSGRDATGRYRDPDLLGHVYAGPYVAGQPELALIVADADGVCGYLLAAEDTRTFERWQEEEWWPPLRAHYPIPDGDTPDAQLIRLVHAPPRAPDAVVAEYPAHLHMDLLERTRGQGIGRTLVERLIETLRERGSPGVHLDVAADNSNAIGFYRHVGFIAVQPTRDSLYMGLHLTGGA